MREVPYMVLTADLASLSRDELVGLVEEMACRFSRMESRLEEWQVRFREQGAMLEEARRQLEEREARLAQMQGRVEELEHQVEWFRKQLFGTRSERRVLGSPDGGSGEQLWLGEEVGEVAEEPPAVSVPTVSVASHERTKRTKQVEFVDEDSRLRFGPEVPVVEIVVPNPEVEGLDPEEYEVIGERITHRLAQRPGSYVILKYVRRVVKIKGKRGAEEGEREGKGDGEGDRAVAGGTDEAAVQDGEDGTGGVEAPAGAGEALVSVEGEEDGDGDDDEPGGEAEGGVAEEGSRIICPCAPPAIFERSFADVSFLAGLVVEKFRFHLPLYRQHQRLKQCGVRASRGTLTRLVHRVGELLEPIYEAVLSSVLRSRLLTVDETPTPAGRGDGKTKRGYYWGLYGDRKEVAFVFSPSRSRGVLEELLASFEGKLLADGYGVYEQFARASGGRVQLVACWSHTRRQFVEAEGVAPKKVALVLGLIQQLYRVEEAGREDPGLLLRLRREVSRPVMEKLFAYLEREVQESALLPSNRFLRAANYALERKESLRVCLEDPAVPLDTNHLEREFRPHAVGRKNWLFHVTEVGARHAAVFFTLIRCCLLGLIDPVVYLVDVLQRIARLRRRMCTC